MDENSLPSDQDEAKQARRPIQQGQVQEQLTALNEQQALLQEQQALLRAFYDNSTFIMGVAELDGKTIIGIQGNAAAARLFGLEPGDIPNRSGDAFGVSSAENRLWVENYQRSQQETQPVRFDYERRDRQGQPQWLSVTITYLGISRNNRPRFSFIAEDITARKQAEIERHKNEIAQLVNEARLRYQANLLNRVDTPIIATNPDYWITYWNKAAEAMFGWEAAEVLGRNVRAVLQRAESDTSDDLMYKQLLERGTYEGEAYYRCKDGRTILVQFNSRVLRGAERDKIGLVTSFKDITATRRREQNTEFVAAISQDLARLNSPEEILRVVGEKIKAHFSVPMLTFAEVDEARDEVYGVYFDTQQVQIGNSGRLRLSEYVREGLLNQMRSGQTIVVEDVADDQRYAGQAEAYAAWAVRALVMTPFARQGQLQFIISIQKSWPYRWRADEIELLEALAERIYPRLEQSRAQAALAKSQADLAAELEGANLLQQISLQLIPQNQPDALYQQLLQAAMALMHAPIASIQVLDHETNELALAAWHGFTAESARFWARVYVTSNSTYGLALKSGERIIMPDLDSYDLLAGTDDQHYYQLSGIRAVQSTPLISRGGQVVGMLSTHWTGPYQPTERELRLFDVLARQAADLVERAQAEAELRGTLEALREGERILQQTNERFRSSIESLSVGFSILSAVRAQGTLTPGGKRTPVGQIVDFRNEYVNEMTCRLGQRTREEVLGRTFLELFPNFRDDPLFDQYIRVVETGQPLAMHAYPYADAPGIEPRLSGYFDIHAVKFGDGLILTLDDVTEEVRLEEEHQRITREREIHHRLAEQREMERQSYARDIHDGPIQTLSSLAFNLQFIKETYPDPALRLELDQIGLSLKSAVQELRQVINELRPPSVIRFGLSKAIQSHCENLRERYPQITWHTKLANDGQLLPEQTCLALFRIYQEAVNNIIRHSEASKVWVTYRVLKSAVTLEIHDNGKGFNGSQDMVQLTSQNHFGLAGIAERVEAIHGEWTLQSQPGNGTVMKIKVPVQPREG